MVQGHSRADKMLVARLITTLAAWFTAFTLIMAMLTFLGDYLHSLPLPVQALVMSGILVLLMTNVVMPALTPAISRLLSKPDGARRRENT